MRRFDEALFMSMGSDREWLEERVLDVDGWLKGLPTIEVIMSDQIPYWVKIGREKQLYTQIELLTDQGRRGEKHLERHPGMSQKIVRADVESEAVAQTRQTKTQRKRSRRKKARRAAAQPLLAAASQS